MRALKEYNIKNLIVAGGVSANKGLRESLKKECDKEDIKLSYPRIEYCTDNAAMIAKVGHYLLERNIVSSLDAESRASYQLDEFMKKSA